MSIARIATERLFSLLFWLVRSAFLVQGAALGAALMATSAIDRAGAPDWLEIVLRSAVFVSATLFLTGVLLAMARRLPFPRPGDDTEPSWPWPTLLALSLVVLPALAYARASELFSLWDDISKLLDRIGFWTALGKSDPYGGIVVLPILVALFVPTLEAVAAFFLIAAPPAAIVLLVSRSQLFPKIFAMLIACQAGIVLAGLISADAFSRVATEAFAVMSAAEDVEVQRAADELRRAQGVLASTAAAFVAPMSGYLAWLPFVLLSRRVGAFFHPRTVSAPT